MKIPVMPSTILMIFDVFDVFVLNEVYIFVLDPSVSR